MTLGKLLPYVLTKLLKLHQQTCAVWAAAMHSMSEFPYYSIQAWMRAFVSGDGHKVVVISEGHEGGKL